MDFGATLRKLRKQKGWSQEEVADKLGISQNTYSKWELGETRLKAEIFPKLAEIYKMELPELLQNFYGGIRFFYNNEQKGGNYHAGNVVVDHASEKLVTSLQSQVSHLQGEIDFLRNLVQARN